MTKLFILIKKPKVYIPTIIAVLLVILIVRSLGNGASAVKTVQAKIGNIEQIVSTTGRIIRSNTADLAFQRSGRIGGLYVKVGQKVYAGQVLAALDMGELNAQKMSAQASVDSAKAKLNQLLSGARAEDINILQINLDNAKKTLGDLVNKNAVDTARNSLNIAINSMVSVTDVQSRYFNSGSFESLDISQKKEAILFNIFDVPNLGTVDSWYFLTLNSGLKDRINKIIGGNSSESTKALLADVKNVLFLEKDLLDQVYSNLLLNNGSEIYSNDISTAKLNVLNQIGLISNQEQAILNAESSVRNAQAQLDSKKAPASQFDIDITKAQVTQAEAGLALIQAQINQNLIITPISGIVSIADVVVGELSIPNKNVVSVLGDSKYEINANIPEADISKVKIGDKAKITVDAYGQDTIWNAQVINIYPAESMIEGVATYKTIIQLLGDDSKIKSGMTANIDIQNDKRENVLTLPQRSVYQKDGKKYVRLVINKDDAPKDNRFANLTIASQDKSTITYEVPVEIGLKGSDGKVEILSGVKEGDIVVQ